MKSLILVTAFSTALGAVNVDNEPINRDLATATPKFTQEEVNKAQLCFLGTMIAICAGDKQMATGVFVSGDLAMKPLPDWWIERTPKMFMSEVDKNTSGYTFIAEMNYKQTDPNYSTSIYVVDKASLAHLVDYANKHPDWNPFK